MPTRKVEQRRIASRQTVRELLQDIVAGGTDPYLAYRGLYKLWCANNAALQELRPMFRIEGIEPDGHIAVTAEFREQVMSLALQILQQFPD